MLDKMIQVLSGFDIPGFKNPLDLYELPGSYVKMESKLPEETASKLFDENEIYLCCQIEATETERYGVAGDEKQIVIYRHAAHSSESEVFKIIVL